MNKCKRMVELMFCFVVNTPFLKYTPLISGPDNRGDQNILLELFHIL